MEKRRKLEFGYSQATAGGRLYKLLLSEDHSDVTFLVGTGNVKQYFRAHRIILSTASDVFKAMFFGSLPEGDRPIEIPDVHPDGFSTMLRYVYEGRMQFESVLNAINTLAVANKYLLEELGDICCSYLARNLTAQCACVAFEAARLFGNVKLERAAFSILICDTENVLEDESFLYAKQDTVQFILSQSVLEFASESQLFNAVLRWGRANMKKRETGSNRNNTDLRTVVQPLLSLIRFLSMSAVEFAKGPGMSGLLTDEEVLSFLMNILHPGSRYLPLWVSSNTPRKRFDDSCITVDFCSYKNHTSFSRVRSFQFTFDVKEIMLLHVIVFYMLETLRDVSFKVDLFNVTRDYSVSDCDVRTGQYDKRCRIIFNEGVLFYPGERCKIKISFKSDVHIARCEEGGKGCGIHEIQLYDLTVHP